MTWSLKVKIQVSVDACWEKRVGAFGVAGTLRTKKPNVGQKEPNALDVGTLVIWGIFAPMNLTKTLAQARLTEIIKLSFDYENRLKY